MLMSGVQPAAARVLTWERPRDVAAAWRNGCGGDEPGLAGGSRLGDEIGAAVKGTVRARSLRDPATWLV
jgi:hypothetical protein